MKKVRITAVRKACYLDLMEQYENPIEHACDVQEGQLWYALMIFAFYPAIIIARLKDEEALLRKELPGYADYQKKVKYRLIPFIW